MLAIAAEATDLRGRPQSTYAEDAFRNVSGCQLSGSYVADCPPDLFRECLWLLHAMLIKRDLTSAKPKQPHESEMSTSTRRAFFAVSLWLSQEPHSLLGKLEGLILSAEDLLV